MKESLRTFMDGLIDYAGLFPPADLPLNEAIKEYISQINSSNSQMLSRFIIHTSKLNDLDEFIPLFDDIVALKLSVLGGGGNSDYDRSGDGGWSLSDEEDNNDNGGWWSNESDYNGVGW